MTIDSCVYSGQMNTFIMNEWLQNTVPFKQNLLPLVLRKKKIPLKSRGCNCFPQINAVPFQCSPHRKWRFSLRISSVNVTTADLVTFTEEILNGKLHYLCSGSCKKPSPLDIMDGCSWCFKINTAPLTEWTA